MNEFAGVGILVVDDELPARRLAARVLTQHGFSCTEASSEAEALESVACDTPSSS